MITDGTLHLRIKKIYSSLTDEDFWPKSGTIILKDDSDGKGAYISTWTHSSLSQPTEEQIKAVTL